MCVCLRLCAVLPEVCGCGVDEERPLGPKRDYIVAHSLLLLVAQSEGTLVATQRLRLGQTRSCTEKKQNEKNHNCETMNPRDTKMCNKESKKKCNIESNIAK